MFKIVRKKGIVKGIISVLAVSFLIGIFISWGAGNRGSGKKGSQYIGVIFNKNIDSRAFMNSFKASYILAKLRFGENFYKLKDIINLELQAWERLIMLEAARKQRIKIADDVVINDIQSFPLFQSKEGFSLELYELITQNLGMTKREFEEMMRQQLMIETFYAGITDNITMTDQEALEEYKKANESVSLDIINILPEDFKDKINVSVEEAKQYYQEHTENFKEPDKVNIQYIGKDYTEDATEEAKAEIKKVMNDAYKKLKKTENVYKVAEEHSLQVKETGLFAINEPITELGWLPEFANEAFSLAPEVFSKPLDTKRGYYILKVKEKKLAHIPEFEQAQDKVTETLKKEKSHSFTKEEASKYKQEIDKRLSKNSRLTLKQIADKLKLKCTNQEDFKRNSYLPGLGFSKEAQEFAFDLTREGASEVIEAPAGFYILKRTELKRIDEEKFNEEKEGLKERFLQQKKDATFVEFVEKELKPKTSLFVELDKDKKLPY